MLTVHGSAKLQMAKDPVVWPEGRKITKTLIGVRFLNPTPVK